MGGSDRSHQTDCQIVFGQITDGWVTRVVGGEFGERSGVHWSGMTSFGGFQEVYWTHRDAFFLLWVLVSACLLRRIEIART